MRNTKKIAYRSRHGVDYIKQEQVHQYTQAIVDVFDAACEVLPIEMVLGGLLGSALGAYQSLGVTKEEAQEMVGGMWEPIQVERQRRTKLFTIDAKRTLKRVSKAKR